MKDLRQLRKEIDSINLKIISLLKKRLEKAIEIAKWKKVNDSFLHDPKREQIEMDHFKEIALSLGLDPTFVMDLMNRIILYNKEEMQKEMEDESDYPRS